MHRFINNASNWENNWARISLFPVCLTRLPEVVPVAFASTGKLMHQYYAYYFMSRCRQRKPWLHGGAEWTLSRHILGFWFFVTASCDVRIQIINTITCLIHWHRQSDVDKLFSVRGFNEHMKVKESNNGSLPTRLYEPVWVSSFLDLNVPTIVKRKTTCIFIPKIYVCRLGICYVLLYLPLHTAATSAN